MMMLIQYYRWVTRNCQSGCFINFDTIKHFQKPHSHLPPEEAVYDQMFRQNWSKGKIGATLVRKRNGIGR